MFICCGILFNHESERRGIDFVTRKITDAVAKATGKKGGCGCKKRAEKLDKIHEKVSNMFQGNKKQD